MTKAKNSERAVIVTTAHRGVFYGWAKNTIGETVSLRAARLCIRWTRDLRGFMGLAAVGPSSECIIGPRADIELRNITSVIECSSEAVKKWESHE